MIRLYLLGFKGLQVISTLESEIAILIDDIIIAQDKGVQNDYYSEIIRECKKRNINFFNRREAPDSNSKYSCAIGWRWIINDNNKVIVFHDSLLPRLRGFNPLVTTLINGDTETGVTALFAANEYDAGPIINQLSLKIEYPIKINDLIKNISVLYTNLFIDIVNRIKKEDIRSVAQNESSATYSIWRDKEDYSIDWNWDSDKIKRFIDAVGSPYEGAKTVLNAKSYRIYDAEIIEDVIIENRTPGKVIFKDQGGLTIICGKGLLRIKNFYDEDNKLLDYSSVFRLRFTI